MPLEQDESETPRSGTLLSSQGIEWSLIWLVVGILGMVFLFFTVIGTGSTVQPTYDRDSQIAPRNERGAPERSAEPEVGADAQTEST